MESNKKINVRIIIKKVSDRQDHEIANNNGDAYLMMNQIRKILDAVSLKSDEQDKDKVIRLLNAAKLSNEIMADAYIDIDRTDLWEDKLNTINAINDIIKTINNT